MNLNKISFFIEGITNPLQTNKTLYSRYSSSQTYYYSNVTAQILKQRRTTVNITYKDTECLCDSQEQLKRFYQHSQFATKMLTFKEYYFYHEDCPRIFMKSIQEMYSKWQDRRRDLVYKKLKILYNQSFSSSRSSSKDDQNKSASGITHFLLQISDYNPFSKKYYLRVEARKQERQNENEKNRTLKDLLSLNHDLSVMLNDMSQLSNISTLQQQQSPRFSSLYHSKKLKVNCSSEYSTNHNSQSNSKSQSSIKFNFKKDKHSSRQKQKVGGQLQRKLQTNDKSEQRMANLQQKLYNSQQKELYNSHQRLDRLPQRLSPKYFDMKLVGKQGNDKLSKSKSIFQISSFGSGRKNEFALNFNSEKKELLKLKTDKRVSSRQNAIPFENKAFRRYESEKKALLQSQSNKKMPHIMSNVAQINNFQSWGKKTSSVVTSTTHLKPIPAIRREASSIAQGNIISKNDEFSDARLQRNGQIKFRSHKSQYLSAPKVIQKRVRTPTKVSFKINTEKRNPNKQKLQIQIGKKGNQLKIQ